MSTFSPFDASTTIDFSRPQCWEKCYQWQTTESNREIMADIYEAGMEARRIKNINSCNATVYIIDNTLSEEYHNEDYLNLQDHEEPEAIWLFQLNLMAIISVMLGASEFHNPIFVVQFNERAGWTCDNFNCLNCCEAIAIRHYMQPVTLNATSDLDGNIEAGCRMGKYATMEYGNCGATIDNEFAIAIVNSDFHSHVHKKGHYDDYSPCEKHFDHRYIIGTHVAEYDDLVRWGSRKSHWKKIDDNAASMEVAENLVECMYSRCCDIPGIPFTSSSTTCKIANGHYGQDIVDFDNHYFLEE